jgi:predicted small lipoprotein YifL
MKMKTTTGKNKHAVFNSRWRAKINDEVNSITTELNAKRAELGLPPVSWTFEQSCTFKGRKRPVYLPPEELRASMTKQQVSQWQNEERKKRKALKQRENRMRKKALLDQMKRELVELNHRVEEKKKREMDTLPSDINKTKPTLRVTADDDVRALFQWVEQELLVADPYIEDDVDTAPWSDDDEILVSAVEIAKVFDTWSKY